MSLQTCLAMVDDLLDVLRKVEKGDYKAAAQQQQKQKPAGPPRGPLKYFKSADEVTEGKTVVVTTDFALLQKEWAAAELGQHDELKAFLGQVGKVQEIEEDDDTIQIRWENFDTCWMPILACADAKGAKPTSPGMANSWLSGEANADAPPPPVKYFKDEEEASEGMMVLVSRDPSVLAKAWEEAGLGPNDEMSAYCGQVGKVVDLEDDGTIQIRWGNYDTVWVPAKACSDAGAGAEATMPGLANSWLSGEEKKEEQPTEGSYLKSEEDVEEGQVVRVTLDQALLDKAWAEAELGANDDKGLYCGVYGRVVDAEDDGTLQLRWENYDTVWIPAAACMLAREGQKPTCPPLANSWLSGDEPAAQGGKAAAGDYFDGSEDARVSEGAMVKVTDELALLEKEWAACELGANDAKGAYLNQVGKVVDIEDDDTLQLRWGNYDTVWIPAKACFDAKGADATCPVLANSWLGDA